MASNEVYLQGSKVQQFNNWGALVKDKERLESVYENATKVDQNALSEKQRIQAGDTWVESRSQSTHLDVLDLRDMLNKWKVAK